LAETLELDSENNFLDIWGKVPEDWLINA